MTGLGGTGGGGRGTVGTGDGGIGSGGISDGGAGTGENATGGIGAGLRLAVGTLTIVPVGDVGPITRGTARWAMMLAPVAVLPLAAGAAAVAGLGQITHLSTLVIAGLVLAFLGWATRAMHWDGLADTADGLAASWDRERALEVMRRGDAGPVAVGVLALVLLIDAAALAVLLDRPWGAALIAVVVIASRVSCALTASTLLRAARPDGLGVVVAGSVPVVGSVVTVGLVMVLVAGVGTFADVPWWQSCLAVAVASASVVLLLRRCQRAFGGVTGDVMGAGIEVAQCVLLVALSAGVTT